MNRISTLAARVEAGVEALGMVVLVVMLSVISYQVFARYVLEAPTFWSEELARFLMAWVTMLGSAALIRKNDHIAVDFFVNRLPLAGQRFAHFVCDLLTLGTCGLLGYYGTQLMILGSRTSSPGMGLKMAYPYAAIPVGALLLAVMLLLSRIAAARGAQSSDQDSEVANGR